MGDVIEFKKKKDEFNIMLVAWLLIDDPKFISGDYEIDYH